MPSPDQRRIVILTGARQTGKTTLLKKVYPTLRYVNLDVLENREWLRGLSALNWAETLGKAVIDEAQKESSVFEKVKYAFDERAADFTALSGSAQILLLSKVRESLAGRAFVYELWPLMFSEVLGGSEAFREPLCARLATCARVGDVLDGIPPELPPDETNRRRQVMRHLLKWGGMPELLGLNDADRRDWLRSYEATYLERDLGDLARLSDLAPFRKLQRLTALRTASLLSYSELARDGGFSVDTARRYLEYLGLSYQTFLLPPYHVNLTSQVVKSPKVFWADVGLARQVGGVGRAMTGGLFETFVVSELYKWVRSSGADMRLFYYRTRSGLEVDVIIETPNGLIGVEIKMREKAGHSDAAGLRRVAEGAGSRWLGGLVVHGGTRLEPLCEPDIWSVPAIRLLG